MFEIFKLSIFPFILTLNLKSEFSKVLALIPKPSDPNNRTFFPFQLFLVKSFDALISKALIQKSLDFRYFNEVFIFDTLNQSKLTKFQSFYLYENQKNINQFSDAKLVLKLLNKYNSRIIILDDQRFNYDWQKIISKKRVKVISFSEGNKKKTIFRFYYKL